MVIVIKNVYNNTKLPGYKSGHGQSFYIEANGKKFLFDIGTVGKDVLSNMHILGIDPNEIDLLVLSHGHYDHTSGLPEFLKKREKPLTIIAHPNVLENKKALFKKWIIRKKIYIGFPKLKEKEKEKVEFKFVKELYQISENIYVSGEITHRPERDGTNERLLHKDGRNWVRDPLIDDQSLIIEIKEGLIIICGCCHAGLLNTLAHVSTHFPEKNIHAILGGTHMLVFHQTDLERVADVLEERYNKPLLYLNHCTGNYAIDYLKERFGDEIVKSCHVGTILEFD
ncbi:MAG: MBL fold metallo-hydrolase [Candidatus Heimdallarchaeaceae archaeon]